MLLNENNIRRIVKESISQFLMEDHLKIVDNIDDIISLIDEYWESPDDAWWIKIESRLKDFKGYNRRNPKKKPKFWKQVNGPDGTKRENHVGYVIVRGATKEACIRSLKNAVVHLNPWAARIIHSRIMYSNGNADAIRQVCRFFFARAYITINKRSLQSTIDRSRLDKQTGMFKGREFHHRIGQTRTGIDSAGVNWSINRPLGLIDCDIDNVQAQKELDDYLKKNNVRVLLRKQSHDGMHYVISIKDAENLDFSFLNNNRRYVTNNRPNDPSVLFKPDANLLLYSAVG